MVQQPAASDTAWTCAHCPAPPDWQLDWRAICSAYPWLDTLDKVPQDPVYHAEGDVLTHTRMVAEALCTLAAWRFKPATERAILFAAALLHDIGKPRCTQIAPDGHIRSPGHARTGAALARQLLWTNAGFGAALPFTVRETIVALVRLHGLPIWFLEKDAIEPALISASYRVQLADVALLAEADARGRSCTNQAELLSRIELFRESCRELACLNSAYSFPSAHSRVVYFRRNQSDRSYHAYDDSWGEVTMLAGLPGAGKDTWLHDHPHD